MDSVGFIFTVRGHRLFINSTDGDNSNQSYWIGAEAITKVFCDVSFIGPKKVDIRKKLVCQCVDNVLFTIYQWIGPNKVIICLSGLWK